MLAGRYLNNVSPTKAQSLIIATFIRISALDEAHLIPLRAIISMFRTKNIRKCHKMYLVMQSLANSVQRTTEPTNVKRKPIKSLEEEYSWQIMNSNGIDFDTN